MDVKMLKQPLVELGELKDNLRLERSFELHDDDLTMKLQAAIEHAGNFISRDLESVPEFSYPFAKVVEIDIDPALHIDEVSVAGVPTNNWSYAGGLLSIYDEAPETAIVKVSTSYKADIKIAVLMHASSLWLSPADSVETLPKASTNLLSQYRQYGHRR